MQRFKEGDLVRHRVFDDFAGDWQLVKNEMWVFLKTCEDYPDRSYGEFLNPMGEIIKAPQAYFVDEKETEILHS